MESPDFRYLVEQADYIERVNEIETTIRTEGVRDALRRAHLAKPLIGTARFTTNRALPPYNVLYLEDVTYLLSRAGYGLRKEGSH
jgi:hypothetical protein